MRRILLLLCCLPLFAFANQNIDNAIERLDHELKLSKRYDHAKEKNIAGLREKLVAAKGNRAKFEATRALYNAYISYQYDSAFVYAQREIALAHSIKDPSAIVLATSDKVYTLISAGLYKEASDELEHLDVVGVNREAKRRFFLVSWRLNADLTDYDRMQPYVKLYVAKARVMCDSLLKYYDKNSWLYSYIESLQMMKEGKHHESIPILKQLLRAKNKDLHRMAIVYSNLGWAYRLDGKEEEALPCFAISACYDIQTSTKETTSARETGSLLYAMGDYAHAIAYVQKALEDANFYGSRQRMIEINNILPIIQRDRYTSVARQRNTMIVAISIISVLFIILCVTLVTLRRKMKELQDARSTIEDRNKQLEHSNKELEHSNRELQEADKIKIEYIGRSLTINSDYINMMEKLYRTLDHKIMAHQYEDLLRSLQESKLNAQRKSMYNDFDDAFLAIFPNFIESYNSLFAPENRKEPEKGQKLTTEMRIFALIRLGVTDADRIASFLHYSVNTINTYKTRVKNKSLVSNEEFEERIMAVDAL